MVVPMPSVSESFARPTSMMYRNMLAMEVEETIRSLSVDGAVLSVAATRPHRAW